MRVSLRCPVRGLIAATALALAGIPGGRDTPSATPLAHAAARPADGTCSTSWLAALSHAAAKRQGPAAPAGQPIGGGTDVLVRALGAAPSATIDQSGFVIPNDPLFWTSQENLKIVNGPGAWAVSYGGSDVTVAVISTGIDLTHPDLVNKLWRNEHEVADNGLDDDGNGYVDDVHGWSFPEGNGNPADFPEGARGTMSAGIIGAETNNRVGVAGTTWGGRLMPLKVLYLDGNVLRGAPEHVTEAICYAADNGARVIFIEGWFSETALSGDQIVEMGDAIEYAHTKAGAVVVAPAGDCGGDDPPAWCPAKVNGIEPPIYPAHLKDVIGVQAVSAANKAQHPHASRGDWVDLAAPGWDFTTTFLNERGYTGVSLRLTNNAVSDLAAAHVAGAAALLLSVNPTYTPLRVEEALCAHADRTVGGPYEFVQGRFWNSAYGCGLLNIEAAVENMQWVVDVRPSPVTVYTEALASPQRVMWSANLNEGNWDMGSEDSWLFFSPVTQITGEPARVTVTANTVILASEQGGVQAGDVFPALVRACPNPEARGDCTEVPFTLRIVDELRQLRLPAILTR